MFWFIICLILVKVWIWKWMEWTVRHAIASRSSSSLYGRTKQIHWRWKWHDACYRHPCCRQYVTGGFANSLTLPMMSASGGRSDAWWYTALCWRERAIRLGTIAPPISCFITATLISECVDSNASTKFLCLLSVGGIVLCILQIIFFLAHWTINSNLSLNTLNSHVKNIAIVSVDNEFWKKLIRLAEISTNVFNNSARFFSLSLRIGNDI